MRHPITDAVLGVTTATFVAVTIALDLGGERNPDLMAYLFAVCLGALMLVRRQFPVLALIATVAGLLAYYAAGYPAIGLALPVAAALYSAAEAGRLAVATGAAIALVLTSTYFRLREGDNADYLLGFELASTVGLMVSAIALGATARATRLLRAEKQRTARHAVAEERLRIARDLHDSLGHTIAVISVQSSVATEALDDDPAAVRAALDTIRLAGDEASRELRDTLGLLTAREPRKPVGSLRHLDKLVATTVESGLDVHLTAEGTPGQLPMVVDTAAYRIVQESLTNCLRHARASNVDVLLRYAPDRLDVTITDDGVGAAVTEGRGLAGMRQRAALLGGRVEISSRPGAGFRVDASLPVVVP